MLDNEPIGRNQKLAAAGLAVFAMLIIVLWFAQLRNNIYGPFMGGGADQGQSASADNQALANEQALKNKDTDADGLSDWDELNVYKTSPYLEDSDSDGLKDGQEVKNNTDPNCPRGKTCASSSLPAGQAGLPDNSQTAPASDNGLNSLLNQFNAAGNSAAPANLNSEQIQTLKNIDAASLRQLLLQNGMQKDVLDKISDADLMKSYGEVLQP